MTLLLRFEGPMMAFGGVAVDAERPTEPFPTASMLTGLLANALGFDHGEFERLQALQDGLSYVVVGDPGHAERDYQTVDLGQAHLLAPKTGWTTRGRVQERAGGTAKVGTHIRNRHYRVGARYWIAIELAAVAGVSEERCFRALRHPSRPLFFGRKACLPAAPIAHAVVDQPLLEALESVVENEPLLWREGNKAPSGWRTRTRLRLRNRRDWSNQVHVGERWWVECERIREAS